MYILQQTAATKSGKCRFDECKTGWSKGDDMVFANKSGDALRICLDCAHDMVEKGEAEWGKGKRTSTKETPAPKREAVKDSTPPAVDIWPQVQQELHSIRAEILNETRAFMSEGNLERSRLYRLLDEIQAQNALIQKLLTDMLTASLNGQEDISTMLEALKGFGQLTISISKTLESMAPPAVTNVVAFDTPKAERRDS